ncbi:hypothetical protein MVEN_00434200 [Mycena venus]|uniref:Uncharacterized protein n=1 Tax=Mycena venus TaxID=2733690 RepID=A0A8H7DAI0_9AGAR|nr:hypothetical protein MVEN_00434200 [Mycena venus]
MANILARFRRGRTNSLSGPSVLTPTLATTPAAAPLPTQPTAPEEAPSSPLERKIHPDLDSLVANWTPPVASSRSQSDPVTAVSETVPSSPPPFSTALRPSTRRHSIDGVTPVLRPPQTDTHLEDLPEVSVPIPFTAQPQPPTRTQRLLTRLTGAASPPSSSTNLATTSTAVGWSTFGRKAKNGGDNNRPHLTEFGEQGRGSPAPSHGTSLSRSVSQSRSPSQVNLGTPSTTSQQLEDSVSTSGHGRPMTPGSDLPSPSSGFTFGSQGRMSGRASASGSPAPPMPPLDHPAFRGMGRTPHSASQSQTPSQVQLPPLLREARPRSSSSLPSMHSTSRRKRQGGTGGDRAKAQDIFASLRRPRSARRRASAEFSSGQASTTPVFLALGASGGGERDGSRSKPGTPTNLKDQIGPDSGDLRSGDTDGDFKFDARVKRVAGSSDTQLGDPFVWPDIPPQAVHSNESSSSTMDQKKATPLLMPPSLSFTAATPEGSPAGPHRARTASDGPSAVLRPPTPSRSHSDGHIRGKRKADAVEGGATPPTRRKGDGSSRSPTCVILFQFRYLSRNVLLIIKAAIHISHSTASSRAPSSFHRQKRAKIVTPEPTPPRPASRTGSVSAANTTSASSRGSAPHPHQHSQHPSRAPSRMSQASLPISALVSPHAPSVARSGMGTAYHMQDPRKPPRVQPTRWGLVLGDGGWRQGGGSPVHAWLFFLGFVLFPLWWVAGFCVPIPQTRRLGDEEGEKGRGLVVDDPQWEFDAKSWRKRCRIMAGVSLVTYVPFIVLLAVFLRRHAT